MAVCSGLLLAAAPPAFAAARTNTGHLITDLPEHAVGGVTVDATDNVWVAERWRRRSDLRVRPVPLRERSVKSRRSVQRHRRLGIIGNLAVDSSNGYLYVADS